MPTAGHLGATLPRVTERAVRRVISREVRRALSAARLTASAAAAKMPGKPDRKLIYRWTNSEVTAPLDRLDEFATAINQPLTLRIGPGTAKEPPEPDWVGRLEGKLDELHRRQDKIMAHQNTVAGSATQQIIEALADPERLGWVEKARAAIQAESRRRSGEGSDDPPASEAQGTGGPGGQASGSFLVRDSEK